MTKEQLKRLTKPEPIPSAIEITVPQLRITTEQRLAADEKARELAELRQRRARVEQQIGERYAFQRCSLNTFRVYDPVQKQAVTAVSGLISRIKESIRAGENILIFGGVGTGKDHLLAALLYAAAENGIDPRWFNGQEVFGQFRDRIDTGQSDEGPITTMARAPVLAISDPTPTAREASAWDLNNLYRIVDRRYRMLRPTWLSMNAESPDDADIKLSAPVFDRLRHNATLIPCFWPSYRVARNGLK